jgi:DNA-directed RNA polymerase specialized sigma24 family protein
VSEDVLVADDSGLSHVDDRDEAERLLSCLTQPQRAAVSLRYLEGMGVPQVARRMQLPTANITALLRAAMSRMRGLADVLARADRSETSRTLAGT